MHRKNKPLRNVFTEEMLNIGLNDPNLVVLVGDISHFALQPFAKACPGRFYNVGICEPTIVSMAAGLSRSGLFPVVHTIAPFLIERSFEQIKLDFCYQKLGGNLISVGSAFDYTPLGCSHYCYNDYGMVKMLPNTQIFYPSMPNEFTMLFKENYKKKRLNYFRLPQVNHGLNIDDSEIKTGRGILVRDGENVTVVVTGPNLKNVVEVAAELSCRRVSVEIIYIHTIKPFDYSLVRESIIKTRNVLVIEEHSSYGGICDEVRKATSGIQYNMSEVNIGQSFIHKYGKYEEHCNLLGFTKDNYIELISKMMNK